ncbi:MAG: hypothetical protein ACLTX6_07975 [Lachnospiraceae bacterium]|nr:MAG TPA: hypothetical protein [Caudoviricetes sp.]
MAIKAKAEITISRIIDVENVIRYYLLQSSSIAAPSKPTANPPGGSWSTTEPTYNSGATNSLYFTDLTIMSNGTYSYSAVSKSSSYEAAKEAWNKANNAQDGVGRLTTRVESAETSISKNNEEIALRAKKTEVTEAINNIDIGGRNLARQTAKAKTWTSSATYAWDTWIGSDGGSGWLPSILIEPEQSYTLSFDYVIEDYTDNPMSVGVGIGAGTTGSNYTADTWDSLAFFKQYGGSIESGHFVYNLLAKSPSQLGNEKYFAFRPMRRFGDNVLTTPIKLTISNFKLEKGNKATDWTPAPEDYYTKTETDASIQVLSDKISQQVSTTDKLGTRLSKVEQDSSSWSVTLETANAAKNAADNASQTASSASSTASAAKLTADNANKTASSAVSTASNAQKTAENAVSTASSASSAATEAKNTADAANKTASNANSTASEAKKTADSANTTAGQAKSTADNASQTASSAKSAADKANENASSAVSTANTAKSTADTAKSTADTARQEASDAAKTATNFMGFDSNGLVVGDRTANTLGKNVLIGNDEIDIRNGTTNYARFAETLIELGLTKDFVLQILNKAIRFIGKDSETAIAHIGYGDCLANNDDDDGNLVTRNQPYYTFGERRPYYKTQNGNGRAALIGEYSCAEGFMTIAEGPYSHVEGLACCVEQVMAAHAEGYGTYANGDYAHTEGLNTAASGSASHAEGSGSLARGYVSHAEGENTQATGEHSHASGYETIASGNEQTVIGRYNTDDTSQLFIIGNGSANDARKNAFTVSETGDITSTGNTVQLIKNNNLVASYDGTTPVLLSTAVYPNADYTGNFSAPVSTQPHGILIEFAPYVDGQAKGYGLVTFFIPKGRCNGESYNIYIDPWCSKWIYVYDDKIVGNDANSKTGTTNGISYNNRKYVLSRVYGV